MSDIAKQQLFQSPGLPIDDDSPVFAEPWQASAFAMTLSLYERGIFSWTEWATTLAQTIKESQLAGDIDDGSTYYHHWLAALERLVNDKDIGSSEQLASLRDKWDMAAKATPHGKPILLDS